MKISELRKREAYDEGLLSTLHAGVERMEKLGWDLPCGDKNVQWYLHPFFSVYVTESFGEAGRHFLREQYAHAPRVMRRIAQRLCVDVLSMGGVFRAALQPAFELCCCPDACESMWMPGNHRMRYFNFARGYVRVFPKEGFSNAGILKEIEFRTRHQSKYPWIVPFKHVDVGTGVFEEPLLSMHPVNREPDAVRRQAGIEAAFGALQTLHQLDARMVHPEAYLDFKREAYERARDALREKFGGLDFGNVEQMWSRSAKVIREARNIEVSLTHGDFQPGNILVGYDGGASMPFALIDWEDVGVRASVYDEMTFLLQSRAPRGLYNRLLQWRRRGNPGAYGLSCSPELAAALWSIEEWIWLCETSSRPGILEIPHGLELHFREIAKAR